MKAPPGVRACQLLRNHERPLHRFTTLESCAARCPR